MEKKKSSLSLKSSSKQGKSSGKAKTVIISGVPPQYESPQHTTDTSSYKTVLKESVGEQISIKAPPGCSPSSREILRSSSRQNNSEELEFHCSFDDSNNENTSDSDLPCTQIVSQENILLGVVAYIDARSNTENRFEGISKQMELLGAIVVRKFIPEVTHVVFKDGKKATRDKAIKKGIHLVTVLWVESCRQTGKRVSEDLFPVVIPDEIHTPLMIGRLKRTKSMQPKSFEEDVRNSAERVDRKRRRVLAGKARCIGSPMAKILCEDTQAPYSPLTVRPSLSPGCIPDTQTHWEHDTSQQEKNTDDSSEKETKPTMNSPTADSMSKRLEFGNSLPGSVEDNMSNVSNTTSITKRKRKVSSTKTPLTAVSCQMGKNMNTPASSDTPIDILQTGSGPLKKRKRNTSSKEDSSASDDNPKGIKKKSAEDIKSKVHLIAAGNVNSDVKPARGGNARRSKSMSSAEISQESTMNAASGETVTRGENKSNKGTTKLLARGKQTRRDTEWDTGLDTGDLEDQSTASDSGVSVSENETKTTKTETSLRTDNQVAKKKRFNKTAALVNKVSKLDSESTGCEGIAEEMKVTAKKVKFSKTKRLIKNTLSKEDKNEARSKTLTNERYEKTRPDKIKHVESEEDENEEGQSTEDDDVIEETKNTRNKGNINSGLVKEVSSDEKEESTEDDDGEGYEDKLKRKASKTNGELSKGNKKMKGESIRKKKPRRSLVLTSMHFGEQDIVVSVVRKLGGFCIADKVGPNTTHIIAGSPRRTLNVLLAIARGCWLVSPEWVMKSLESGYWIDEEPYELADDFPSAQLCRLERVNTGPSFREELFSDVDAIFVSENTSPPKDALVNLITLCGGQVCTSIRKAGVCIGSITRKTEANNVTESWVIDSITEHSVLPFATYALNTPPTSIIPESPTY